MKGWSFPYLWVSIDNRKSLNCQELSLYYDSSMIVINCNIRNDAVTKICKFCAQPSEWVTVPSLHPHSPNVTIRDSVKTSKYQIAHKDSYLWGTMIIEHWDHVTVLQLLQHVTRVMCNCLRSSYLVRLCNMTLSTEWNILWIIQTSKSLSKHWRNRQFTKVLSAHNYKFELENEKDTIALLCRSFKH